MSVWLIVGYGVDVFLLGVGSEGSGLGVSSVLSAGDRGRSWYSLYLIGFGVPMRSKWDVSINNEKVFYSCNGVLRHIMTKTKGHVHADIRQGRRESARFISWCDEKEVQDIECRYDEELTMRMKRAALTASTCLNRSRADTGTREGDIRMPSQA